MAKQKPLVPSGDSGRDEDPLWVHPLKDLYEHAGLVLPPIATVEPSAIPEPYRQLLAHRHDMTPTLANYHRNAIHLEILRRERRGPVYFREVVLRLDGSERPVEFGANRVSLQRFDPEPRRLILEEHLPLGKILEICCVPHYTRADAFLCLEADRLIQWAFGLTAPKVLYGRHATIRSMNHQPLSEIVEILPP